MHAAVLSASVRHSIAVQVLNSHYASHWFPPTLRLSDWTNWKLTWMKMKEHALEIHLHKLVFTVAFCIGWISQHPVPHSLFFASPKIPVLNHVAVVHTDTGMSGPSGRVCDVQRRPPQRQKYWQRSLSLSRFNASSTEVFPKPLISRASSHQALSHSQNSIPVDLTIHDKRWFLRNDSFAVYVLTIVGRRGVVHCFFFNSIVQSSGK